MTNKEYKQARQAAENANELYTFEHYAGGLYCTRYMSSDDKKELRADYRDAKKAGAFALEGFKGRAVLKYEPSECYNLVHVAIWCNSMQAENINRFLEVNT